MTTAVQNGWQSNGCQNNGWKTNGSRVMAGNRTVIVVELPHAPGLNQARSIAGELALTWWSTVTDRQSVPIGDAMLGSRVKTRRLVAMLFSLNYHICGYIAGGRLSRKSDSLGDRRRTFTTAASFPRVQAGKKEVPLTLQNVLHRHTTRLPPIQQ